MHFGRMCMIWLLLFLLALTGGASGAESQFLGYEQNVQTDVLSADDVTNQTLLTDVRWQFPSDGQIIAFHVRIQGDDPDNDVTVQIWRPEGSHVYSLVGESDDVNVTSAGTQRVEPRGVIKVRRGDVLGLSYRGENPVPYQTTGVTCETSWAMSRDGTIKGDDQTGKTFDVGEGCRRYLVTAEYMLEPTDLRMDILGFDIVPRSMSDNTTNSVVIPNPNEGFPVPGELYGWKAFIQEPHLPVKFQVWRPLNSTSYRKIHETTPLSLPITGAIHTRLRPHERVQVLQGDVIALSHAHQSPLHYELGKDCEEDPTLVKRAETEEGAGFVPVGGACRHYSLQAEYHKADVTAAPHINVNSSVSVSPTSNLPVNVSVEPVAMTTTSSTSPQTTTSNTTDTVTSEAVTTELPSSSSTGSPPSTTSVTMTTEPVTMETSSPSQISPTQQVSTVGPSEYFGWELEEATRTDGVHYGTIIPDVGKVFPHDGKIIGWELNITTTDHKVGLQVWRPMPRHPNLFPHGRDFAFVGETKPVWLWHVGLNSFRVDQVGEAPIHVRAGDVIGVRLDQPNPIPFADSSECEQRFYMDHHGRYDACDQFVFQATGVCRIYPIRALVIWDKEQEKKPKDCTDISESLVPGGGGTPSHIDGCLVLNVKSPEAMYLLTNPEYPNITKHRDLCWVIHLDPSLDSDLYIQVRLNDLDLHVPNNPRKCDSSTSDFLEMRDGKSSHSDLLRRYCVGWPSRNDVTRTEVMTACQHFMYIRMRTSTSSFYFRGFKLHYQAINKDMLHKTCIRPMPLNEPAAARSRNAAIITILVVVVVIAAVFIIAYIRKRGFKSPRWLSFFLFKHQRFDNPINTGLHSNDSPNHMVHHSDHPSGGGINQSEYQLQRDGFDAAYVQFSPGGYPNNGQPVLRLGNIDSKTANAPSIMEGVSELPEVTSRSPVEVKADQDGGMSGDHDLFPPPSDSFRNNNVTILPSHHVIVDREPSQSIT